MTEDHKKSFAEAADPLIKWINENANPHATVIVTPTCAELVTGEMAHHNSEFVRD